MDMSMVTGPGPRARQLRRRILAGVLLAVAAGALVVDAIGPSRGMTQVVVASRSFDAGTVLEDSDVTIREFPTESVPEGVVDREAATGRYVAGPVAAGEILTEQRLAGGRLAELLTADPEADVVAVTPQDSGLTPMLRTGDRVDVLTAGEEPGSVLAIARGARVISTPTDGRLLLATDPDSAAAIAAAGLGPGLTVILSHNG